MQNYLIQILISYLLVINIITFVIRGIDKWKAVKGKRRIKEKRLLLFVGIGGFLGAVIGMSLFHHKTIKGKFLQWFWLIVFAWIILSIVLLFSL